MTALRRLAAALAACSTFTTTLALPKASSDAPSSIVTPVVHAIKEKGTANTSGFCTFQEQEKYDNYGITVPTKQTQAKCDEFESAIQEYREGLEGGERAMVCQPYGSDTIIIFSANKNSAEGVAKPTSDVYPEFDAVCTNSTPGRAVTSGRSAADPVPAICNAPVETIYGGEKYILYDITVPTPYSETECNKVPPALQPYAFSGLAIPPDVAGCFASERHEDSTQVFFDGILGSEDAVNAALANIYPEFTFECDASTMSHAIARDVTSGRSAADPEPATCTISQLAAFTGDWLNYTITVPTPYSETQCDQAIAAVQDYIFESVNDSTCYGSGDQTHIYFSGTVDSEEGVNAALANVYPQFAFECEDATASHATSRDIPLQLPPNVVDPNPEPIDQQHTGPNPPAMCTVQEQRKFDMYSIIINTPESEAKCTKAQDATQAYRVDDSWICQPYGTPAMMITFMAYFNSAESINSALSQVFPGFEFQCAGPHSAPALVKKSDPPAMNEFFPEPVAPNAQHCLAVTHGLWNSYGMQIGVPLDTDKCRYFGRLLHSHTATLSAYHCGDDHYGGTEVFFDIVINEGGMISAAASQIWPSVNGFNCPDY